MQNRQKYALFMAFERWGYDSRGWAKKTRRGYGYRVRAADAWLEEHQGVALAYARTIHLRAYLFSTVPTAKNRNNIRQALVGFFDFLIDNDVIKENPAAALPKLPQRRALPKAIDIGQTRRVLGAARMAGPMIEALLTTFAYTGLRRDEVRTLRWTDLDIPAQWIRFVAKGSKEREMPLHEEAAVALRQWKTQCPDPLWVFPSPRKERAGKVMSEGYLATVVREIGEAAGVPELHPHMLRHTFATTLLELGTDLRTLQEALGHSNMSTTAVYLKVRPARLKEAVSGLTFQEAVTDGGS